MIVDVPKIAELLKRSEQGIRKAAKAGRFGASAHRDESGRWLFTWPDAGEEFRRRTDPGRYSAAQIEPAPKPARAVKVAPVPDRVELPPTFTDLSWFDESERDEAAESYAWLHQRLRNAEGLNDFDRGQVDEIFALAGRHLEKNFSDVEQQHLNYFGAKP